MLLLDFCNIQEWSVDEISGLYDKYQIIHTAEGSKQGKELFCSTKRKEKWRYYFTDKIPLVLGKYTDEFCISPNRPEYKELWKLLQESQTEYRDFLDNCRNGKLNLKFINNLMNKHFVHNISEKFPLCFEENQKNEWMPEIRFDRYFLGDIESYIAWEIFIVSLGRIKPPTKKKSSVFECIGRCDQCGNYFYYYRETKKFCSKKCRQDYNYEKSMDSGERQKYQRKWRKENPHNI